MAQIKTNLQYGVTGSLQTGSIAGDAIDGTKIADDAINSEHLAAGGIDTAHIADDQITLAKMAAGTDGNIITYDASGNPAVVAVGTSGHFLKSQGAGSVPVFDAAGGGKILQVQYVFNASLSSAIDTTSNTMATSGITFDITPAATSSKIYIIFETGYTYMPSNSQQGLVVNIKRDATFLGTGAQAMSYNHSPGVAWNNNLTLHVVDSPSTTSAITYSVWFSSVQPSAGTVALAGTACSYCFSGMEIGA